MTEALIVENDEAIGLARELAQRRGTTIDEAVIDSLRLALDNTGTISPAINPRPLEPLTPEQQARFDSLLALAHELAPFRKSGMTSDHSDMYDENGLPI